MLKRSSIPSSVPDELNGALRPSFEWQVAHARALNSGPRPSRLSVVAGAVTNGSFTQEQFHFYDEIDTNLGKTASGRLSLHPPFPIDMELGVSGSYGSQDRSPNDIGKMWFWGIDYQLHLPRVDLKAQYLKGASPGDAAHDVYGLRLHGGGYVEVDGYLASHFGVLGRIEYRDAFVWLGDPNAPGAADRALSLIHI